MADDKNIQPVQVETDPIKIAIPLVKQNEGFKSKAYYDKLGKVWTIGTGITRYSDGTPVKQGDTITEQENDAELYNILNKTNDFLKTRPVYDQLNPNQIAGLLDTAYNIGTGWTKSKNGKLLEVTADPKRIDEIPNVMMMYKNAGGKPVQGLINRRQRAVDLFNTEYTPPPPPLPSSKDSTNNVSSNDIINPFEFMIKNNSGDYTLDTRPSDV